MADMEVTEDELEGLLKSMKYEMALEYYEFNIVGAWVGEYTPVHIKLVCKL
jgi:hypothetical protein